MSSDDAYGSFLDQANQDTGASKPSSTPNSSFATTKAVDTDVPAPLQTVELYYTSEADEPFEPVSLKWSGKKMPSKGRDFSSRRTVAIIDISAVEHEHANATATPSDEFKDLVEHGSDVSIMSPTEFDPHGQYKAVLKAVERSGDGSSTIFRVDHGKTRAEYYVVGHDQERKRIVGLKAKAVES